MVQQSPMDVVVEVEKFHPLRTADAAGLGFEINELSFLNPERDGFDKYGAGDWHTVLL